MSESINFTTAETNSYVFANDNTDVIAKVGIVPTDFTNVKLANPNAWSYCETHSYVKVDPASLNIQVPANTEEVYAKVIYIPGLKNTIDNSISILNQKLLKIDAASETGTVCSVRSETDDDMIKLSERTAADENSNQQNIQYKTRTTSDN